MSEKTVSQYQAMPLHEGGADDNSVIAYGLAHNAAEGSGNTGAYRTISQYHHDPTEPPVDHEFILRRLALYFFINIPEGSTINSATLSLTMMQLNDPFGANERDWTVSIRLNNGLTGPVEPGSYDSTDYATLLGGTQIASKYVDDLPVSGNLEVCEFELPALVGETPVIVPQTYLKLGLISSKDLAGVAPDDTQRMMERVRLSGDQQLILDYTLPTTEVETNPATNITGVSATLNGTLIDGGGEACDCSFQWGLTDAYGETTTPVSKETDDTFDAGITELSSGTTYHFRAKAENTFIIFYGEDLTFTCPGYFAWII